MIFDRAKRSGVPDGRCEHPENSAKHPLHKSCDSLHNKRSRLLGHGNLPCAYDCASGDCSVVRDSGGGPKAPLRLLPERLRAPSTAREGRWPSALSLRHFPPKMPLPSRYKKSAVSQKMTTNPGCPSSRLWDLGFHKSRKRPGLLVASRTWGTRLPSTYKVHGYTT